MKTKTLIELLTLSSSLYYLAKDTEVLEKLKEMAEKGKDGINRFVSEKELDENGEEMEFIDKLLSKTAQVKEEMEQRVEELVTKFYSKINVAHTDEIRALNEKLETAQKEIALLEARLNKIESAG